MGSLWNQVCIYLSWHYGNDGDVHGLNFRLTRCHVLSRFPCEHPWSTCRSLEPKHRGDRRGFGDPLALLLRSQELVRGQQLLARNPVRALRCPTGWKGKLQAQPAPASADLSQTQARPGNETLNKRVLATQRPCCELRNPAAPARSRASLWRPRHCLETSASKQQRSGPTTGVCDTIIQTDTLACVV